MNVRLLEPAVDEFNEAVDWYRGQSAGLAEKFAAEVQVACQRIAEHPHAWHPLGEGVRRFRLKRFPYGLVYVVEAGDILVLAVAHLHREPTYWRARLPGPE